MFRPDDARQVGGEGFRGEGPRGDDDGVALARSGNRGHFLAHDGQQRVLRERARDRVGKTLAIHRERGARGYAARLGGAHHEGAEPPHLLFQQADGVIELVAAERIAADELRQPIAPVNGSRPHRTHLVERGRHAP
jgi:hypothetical protein